MSTTPGQYDGGFLPSQYPEVASLPWAKQFLGELVDMQFQDLRVLLRLPDPQLAPNVGCNFTAAAMLTNLISGFSVWFFHTPYAVGKLEPKEKQSKQGLSKRRFLGFVRAYFPRQLQEPTTQTIAKHLYAGRNVLAHNLGIDDSTWRTRAKKNSRRQVITFSKPPVGLTEDVIVELEKYASPPLAGQAITRNGLETQINIPLLYWATGQMLRRALKDQPTRCDRMARELLAAFPTPKSTP